MSEPEDLSGSPLPGGSSASSDSLGDTAASPSRPPREYSEDAATVISAPKKPLPTRHFRNTRELGAILVGQILGQFRLDEFVGGGGMGAVFRGEDTRLGRTVAVKVVSGDRTDEDTLRRFHNEAQSAARLDHRNIARVYHVGEDSGWHYIVFEYIEGVNIRDLVEFKGPLPIDEALSYALQVAAALDHAFRRDVVHRDIKPSNVLVMPNGVVKLVDMGLARLDDVESPKDDITASGVTLGTFDYISPEQARDPRSADVRSDLYSLGCTLYFMLTGQPPFPQGTVLQKLLSHSSEEPPDIRLFRPELEDEVVALLGGLMEKQPSDRPQQPQDLIDEVHRVANRLNLPLSPLTAPARPDAGRPSLLLRFTPWGIALLLMAATALGVEWVDQGRELVGPSRPSLEAAPIAAPREEPVIGDSVDEIRQGPQPAAPELDVEAPAAILQPPFGWNLTTLPVDLPDLQGDWTALLASESASELAAPEGTETGAIPSAPADITKVIVSANAQAETESGAVLVADLASAMEAVDLHNHVELIELRFNGPMVQSPLRLLLPRPLTIRAATGFQPVLYFEPKLSGLGAAVNSIEVAGEPLMLSGLHIHLRLPQEPADGWNMFFLEDIQSIDLSDCTLTIQNADESGLSRQPNVAFFGFEGEPVQDDMRMPSDSLSNDMIPPIRMIQAVRTSVRGEAALLRSETTESIALNWNQGLIALSGRIAEIIGSPAFPDATVHIELDQVTLFAASGLARVDMLESTATPPEMHLSMTSSVIDVSTDSPLVEHVGIEKQMQAERRFSFSGSENYYTDSVSLRWLLRLRDGTDLEYPFDDKDAVWYQEMQGVKAVMWKQRPDSDSPLHTHLKASYLQDERPANPSAKAGFDPALLPSFPSLLSEDSPSSSADEVDSPQSGS